MSEYKEYIEELSDKYVVDIYIVEELAELLGEDELYDGLVNALEDL